MATIFALVVGLGVGGMWIAWRLRIPSILVLLALGLLVGPIARLVSGPLLGRTFSFDPSAGVQPQTVMALVGLAIAIVLFEGGLTLRWRDIAGTRRVVLMLVTVGAAITWGLSSVAAHTLLRMQWPLALLLGAVLIVTGPTVIGPLLRHIRPTGKSGSVLRWEGIVSDPIGAMVAVLVFEVIASGVDESTGIFTKLTFMSMAKGAFVAGFWGIGIGLVSAVLLMCFNRFRWIPDHLEIPATFAAVVLAFVGANAMAHEAGLFATTVMGIVMANQRWVTVRRIMEFKEIVSTLLIGVLFIVLAARVEPASLTSLNLGSVAFVAVMILFVRPASVMISTLGPDLPLADKLFICAMAPRGIVAAGVSSLFAMRLDDLGVPGAEQLVTITFTVVVCTVLIYGLSGAPLARRLGLARGGQRGFLIVGADDFARAIAKAIQGEQLEVLVVDTSVQNIRAARMMGLPVVTGNALSSEILEQLALSPIGHLLALTSNHEVNSMAAVQFVRLFGRENVFQLVEKEAAGVPAQFAESDRELKGRSLFARGADHATLERWMRSGAKIKKTRLSGEFTLKHYLQRHSADALPLLHIHDGRVQVISTDSSLEASPGDSIISLTRTQEPTVMPQPKPTPGAAEPATLSPSA